MNLQIIPTVLPIRSDEGLVQAHLRLDGLLTAQAYNLPSQDVRDEFEVLTALIYYYEQQIIYPQLFSNKVAG